MGSPLRLTAPFLMVFSFNLSSRAYAWIFLALTLRKYMKPLHLVRSFAKAAFGACLLFCLAGPVRAASTTVLRTNVYHQITSLLPDATTFSGAVDAYSNRQGKKLSADGSKVVLLRPGRGGTNHLYTINYDGSGMALIDTFTDGSTLVDISANGSKVIRFGGVNGVIRVMNSDGSSPFSITNNGTFVSCRLSADGAKVFFASDRNFTLPPSSTVYEAGFYVINTDGTGFRSIIGATGLAAYAGVPVGQQLALGYMGYWNTSYPGFWDVSADGSKLVFIRYTPSTTNPSRVTGMNTDGTGLHDFPFPAYPQTGYFGFYSVGLSGDGTKVFYYLKESNSEEELAVYNWDGSGRRELYQHPYGQGYSVGYEVISLSHDGSRLLFGDSGYLFNTDGSGLQSLDFFSSNPGGFALPSGTEGNPLTGANMNSNATRFAFLNYSGTARYLYQVVTLTPNPASLGYAPALSNPYATPPYWIHRGDPTPVGVTVSPTNGVKGAAAVSLRNGMLDRILGVGLHDDGVNGDGTARDGVYSDLDGYHGNSIYLNNLATDQGPRVLRFVAEATGPDGMIHATTIDAGPFFFLTNAPAGLAPTIDAVNPASAAAGAQVTLSGTGFDPVATNNLVLFGNQTVQVVSVNPAGTQLTVILPTSLPPGTVQVVVGCLGMVSTPAYSTVTPPGSAIPANAAFALRTNVYHQITSLLPDATTFSGAVDAYSNRQGKKLSADGSKVVLLRPGRGGTNHLYTINYDGSGMALIDTFTDGSTLVDISANGSKVIRFGGVNGVIRVMNSDGSSPFSITNNGTFVSCRLSADGAKVFFASDRNFTLPPSSTVYEAGFYVINTDGTGFRSIIGATGLAAYAGVPVGQQLALGYMGYWNTSYPGFWDVSADGSKLVFIRYTPSTTNPSRVTGMNTDGTGLHDFPFPAYPQTGYFGFYSVGLSGDGTKVFYYLKESNSEEELAVYNWDGSGRRELYQHPYGQGYSVGYEVISLSHDGSRLLFGDSGYLFNTDGSGLQSLDFFSSNPGGFALPSGTEGNPLTGANMNSNATRFAFLNYSGTARYLYQVVTLTPNPASLGYAPALSNPYATPPYWIHRGDPTPVGVTVSPTNGVKGAAAVSLRNGMLDRILGVGLHDDGVNGDGTARDGVYSDLDGYHGNSIYLNNLATDQGPRVLRFVAEATGPDGMIHATTIDAGPFFFLTNAPAGLAPTIDAVNPASAAAGAQVTLSGTGFDPIATNNLIKFGDQILTVVGANSAGTQLTVILPANAPPGTVPVIIGAGGQISAPSSFTTTDPFAASLVLQMLAGLQVFGNVGSNYRIDYLSNVQNPNSWSPLSTITLPSSPYFWVDLTSTNQPRRFYRAVRVP